MPSPEVWRAIEKRRRDGRTLSAVVDGMILEPKDEFSSYEVSSKEFFDVASRELAKKRFDN